MKLTKIATTVVIIAGAFAVISAVRVLFFVRAVAGGKAVASGKTFGPADARVSIQEFTDFQCPACAQAAMMLHEEMKKEGSRIFVELKYFPLAMHANARRAAVAAQCALEQDRFWPMQERLFRLQSAWGLAQDPTDHFLGLAREIGADEQKMKRCMTGKEAEVKIDADVYEGRLLGVRATPTFFINGKMVVGGPNFQAALKEALK